MADVKPFAGIRYNSSAISDLTLVVTPPYDVISDEEKRMYHKRHPKNVIRLVLGEALPDDNEENNWHSRAADYLHEWIEEDTLVRDPETAFYLLRRDFADKWGRQRVRYGFTSLVKIDEPEQRMILGHEMIFDEVIVDRLRLIETTKANTCPIFMLYSDPGAEVVRALKSAAQEPVVTLSLEDGSKDTLWAVTDPDTLRFVTDEMKDKILFIADGHHRYMTSRLYRNEMCRKEDKNTGTEPYDYVMITLVALEDEGLAIYPPHRLIRGVRNFDGNAFLDELEQYFDVAPVRHHGPLEEQVGELVQLMANSSEAASQFGVLVKDSAPKLITLKHQTSSHPWLNSIQDSVWRDLDVPILHRLVIDGMLGLSSSSSEHIQYTTEEMKAARLVQSGDYQMALLLNPPTPGDVKKVSLAGELMPQKSTYFAPKLLTGLVINRLDWADA